MAKKSRNNRRKIRGQEKNIFVIHNHAYFDQVKKVIRGGSRTRVTGFITVENIRQDRVIGVFDYPNFAIIWDFDARGPECRSTARRMFVEPHEDELKLWKVEIGGDHLDDQLKNLKLNGSDELSAINEIGEYWTEKLPKKHIHVLVEPPVSTTASNEVLELREKLASLQALLNKSVHGTTCVRYSSCSYQMSISSLRFSLRLPRSPSTNGPSRKCVNSTVLAMTRVPALTCIPFFRVVVKTPRIRNTKKALRKLFDELEMRVATTPIDVSYEATKSIYSYTYLVSATYPFKDQVKVVPEKLIEGKNGRENLDYGIESHTTGRIIGLVEVKKDDFKQGFAQATVQLASSLGRKRKADKMDDEPGFNKVWGIVTDAEKWYFMECLQDDEGKPSFNLTKPPLFVACEDEDIKERAEKVLGHIIWLLEESQKADSAVNEKVIKKRKSLSKVAGNSDIVDKP
ncbi:hypothetical protein RhiirB3_468668 [Rhizophagus irregularis]|nr:hypothetical protein RhiirB3_468668 [Rhizophagus irregularis]